MIPILWAVSGSPLMSDEVSWCLCLQGFRNSSCRNKDPSILLVWLFTSGMFFFLYLVKGLWSFNSEPMIRNTDTTSHWDSLLGVAVWVSRLILFSGQSRASKLEAHAYELPLYSGFWDSVQNPLKEVSPMIAKATTTIWHIFNPWRSPNPPQV